MNIYVRRALRHVSLSPIIVLFLVSVPLLSGCSAAQFIRGGMTNFQDGSSDDASSMPGDSSGGVSQEEADPGDNNVDSGEPGLVELACPTESRRFILVASHTWTFSPVGQTQIMEINGSTNAIGCDIFVAGDVATGEDCGVNFTNTGVIHTDGGDCQLDGQGRGILSFEGSCQDGQIILTITETQDPDTEMGGTMNCSGYAGPYVTFYPPSLTTVTFLIDSEGATANESLSDLTGFNYNKTWTLMPESAMQ